MAFHNSTEEWKRGHSISRFDDPLTDQNAIWPKGTPRFKNNSNLTKKLKNKLHDSLSGAKNFIVPSDHYDERRNRKPNPQFRN